MCDFIFIEPYSGCTINMKLKKTNNYIIFFLFVITFVTTKGIISARKFSKNAAIVIINGSLWQSEITAVKRQTVLLWGVKFLEWGIQVPSFNDPDNLDNEKDSMIRALIKADDQLKKGEIERALWWLNQAIEADPIPRIQSKIILPEWINIDEDGNIVLEWDKNWQFRKDSQVAELRMDEVLDILTITYENTFESRDKIIYQWGGPLDISYWHTLHVEARVHRGTYLTIETHSRTGVMRHVSYFPGNGEWKQFTIPLMVDEIKWIYIMLNEPSADSLTSVYKVEIKPLTLSLDEFIGNNNQ